MFLFQHSTVTTDLSSSAFKHAPLGFSNALWVPSTQLVCLVPVCSRQRSDIIPGPQLLAYNETLSVREHEKTIKRPRQLLLWDMKDNCCEHHFISRSWPNVSCPLLSVWSACFYIVHITFCWEALYLYICNQSERQVKINRERKDKQKEQNPH